MKEKFDKFVRVLKESKSEFSKTILTLLLNSSGCIRFSDRSEKQRMLIVYRQKFRNLHEYDRSGESILSKIEKSESNYFVVVTVVYVTGTFICFVSEDFQEFLGFVHVDSPNLSKVEELVRTYKMRDYEISYINFESGRLG